MSAKLTLAQVFGGLYDGHECCECCNGYCSLESVENIDDVPAPMQIFKGFHSNGIAYLSDRYTAIREDLIDVGDYSDRVVDLKKPFEFPIPGFEPGPSTRRLRASFVHHMANCGIRIRQGGEGTAQHLYSTDGVHVGWMMPSKAKVGPVMTLDQVDTIRNYVAESEINGWAIPVGSGDEWDVAACILNEAARLNGGDHS